MKFGFMRGITFVVLMCYGGLACSLATFPSLISMVVPIKNITNWRRRYNTFILGYFSRFAGLLIRVLYGTRVFIYCEDKEFLNEKNNKVLICSNHRTRIDGMFLIWIYGSVIEKISDLVVILKNDLKSVPIFGWCMQTTLYVFLQRKREEDIPHIQRMLRHLLSLASGETSNLALLIFPEGTDLSDGNVTKSNAYSKEKNLPQRKYVLHPKSAGLITAIGCCREMNQRGGTEQSRNAEDTVLHDVTMAYDDHTWGQRPSEMSLFAGDFPRAVHVLVKRHRLRNLPHTQEELSEWLNDSFTKKELLLKEFYISMAQEMDTGESRTGPAMPCQLASWPPLQSHPLSTSQSSFSQTTLPFLFMSLLMSFLTAGLWADGTLASMFRGYLLLVVLAYPVLTHCGGIESLELKSQAADSNFVSDTKKNKEE